MDFWVKYRRNHYKFQVEPEDLERWQTEQTIIVKHRVAAVLLVIGTVVTIELIKPMVADVSSLFAVILREGVVLAFSLASLGAYILWQNPFRKVTSGGNPGDCTVRGN